MLQQSMTHIKVIRYQKIALITIIILETILVTTALVPAELWTRILPPSSSTALNGPYPASIAPVISLLLYVLPTLIGFGYRSWQKALLMATLPAWIGLGLFLVAATFKIGAFYLVSADHITANISTLELFAALGGIGWLARFLFKID
jgi:hypothetical protein